jgi:hypothetical protein
LRKKHGCLLFQTGNAGETPKWFILPELFVIKHVGERSVQVRMTDVDKQGCTVILAITIDSAKCHHL